MPPVIIPRGNLILMHVSLQSHDQISTCQTLRRNLNHQNVLSDIQSALRSFTTLLFQTMNVLY